MGLLDKALKIEKKAKTKSAKVAEPSEKVQVKEKKIKVSKLSKAKAPKLPKPKLADESVMTKVSLSTGKIEVPEKKFVNPDFKSLGPKIHEKLKAHKNEKSSKIDFSKIKAQIENKISDKRKISIKELDRVPTGISGFDEVIEGGLIKNSCTLVGGGAGCGKTIFCMQFLVNGIDKSDEPGIFITFEESPADILEEFRRFNWDIEKKIKDKKLVILHFSPEEVNKFLESGGGIVRDTIESIDAKRLVIDSLTAFTLLFKDELTTRKAVLNLFESMQKWNVTTLLTSEQEPDPDKHQSTLMEFEVDGVILLYNVRKGDIRERSLEVFKMRATQHSAKIFPMKIDDTGIIIYPEETIF